jgi:hypothetical protein
MENLDKVCILRTLLENKQSTIKRGSSGVYCWWFKKEAAEKLISKLSINNTEQARISKCTIDKKEYWALYFGISEDMLGRAKWHILQKHSASVVKYGTLSTLRQTISALLGVDMSNSEECVNKFIDDNCYWEWEYDYNNYKLRETNELSSITKCYPLNIQENKTVRKEVIESLSSLRKMYRK